MSNKLKFIYKNDKIHIDINKIKRKLNFINFTNKGSLIIFFIIVCFTWSPKAVYHEDTASIPIYRLIEKLPNHVNLIDVENLVFNNQNSNWKDTRLFYLAKQPFSMETIPPLATRVCGKILGKLGFAKKAIILDLDNTLWGGIAGDDGVDGINLDSNSPDGEAYLNFQKYLKR